MQSIYGSTISGVGSIAVDGIYSRLVPVFQRTVVLFCVCKDAVI